LILRIFENLAKWTTNWAGSSSAFAIALATIMAWIILGPFFNYSDTWQLVINTGTTIITFLMVFLLQRAHNKESMAMQLKLNELIAAQKGANAKMINIEDKSEKEIKEMRRKFEVFAESLEDKS
jgi:low affinity Fe/Cu permease